MVMVGGKLILRFESTKGWPLEFVLYHKNMLNLFHLNFGWAAQPDSYHDTRSQNLNMTPVAANQRYGTSSKRAPDQNQSRISELQPYLNRTPDINRKNNR